MPDATPKRPDQAYPAEDAGAYIGHEPELAAETIPGGVRDDDVRVSGVASRPPTRSDEDDAEPDGADADAAGPR